MTDFLVYWKDYWRDTRENPNAIDRYWHTANETFFDEARPGASLWVVVSGGKDDPGEWRLLQRIVIRAKAENNDEKRPYEIIGNRRRSQVFDMNAEPDLAPLLRKLEFRTGKKITARGNAIGNTLQTARPLTPSDVVLLEDYSAKFGPSKPHRTFQAGAAFSGSNKHQKAEKAAVLSIPSEPLEEFFRQASFYRYHPAFQEREREYKIQLGNALAVSRELLGSDSRRALHALVRALKSKDDNIIYWEHLAEFLKCINTSPARAIEPLGTLWDESVEFGRRLTRFSKFLGDIEVKQPGARLSIISTLLMAISPYKFPPVKVDSFSRAMKVAGWNGLYMENEAVGRYMMAQDFMDAMIVESDQFSVKLRDRLDVQGVVWCVSGGWKKVPVPSGWINDPEQRRRDEELEYAAELRDLEAEPGANDLTDTEKLALVMARRGQGRFREDLVGYWDCCAVTECSELKLLVASHIRPWKKCVDKKSRLDKFNGLLLSPALDRAFDKGLITFEDSGRIKITKQLTTTDRKALGIHSAMRLRKPSPRHFPYLRYHRKEVFEKK